MVHRSRRGRVGRAVDQPRGHTGDGAAGGHVFQHDRARGDLGVVTDSDVAQHLGPCAQQHALADLGMAVAAFGTGPAQGHGVQHRHLVADHRRLADDDARAVVEEQARPQLRRWMDVDLEQFGDAALEMEGQGLAALGPEPVRHPPGLQCLESLEIEERLQQRLDRRIALGHGLQIGLGGGDNGRVGGEGVAADLAHAHRSQFAVAQLAPDLEAQGAGQIRMGEDDRAHLGRQMRLIPRRRLGGGAQVGPAVGAS